MPDVEKQSKGIAELIADQVRTFLVAQDGTNMETHLYEMIQCEVEKGMFAEVLKFVDYNQIRASRILGINRNTLRRKLRLYGMMKKG